jgi:hypothetical protein
MLHRAASGSQKIRISKFDQPVPKQLKEVFGKQLQQGDFGEVSV